MTEPRSAEARENHFLIRGRSALLSIACVLLIGCPPPPEGKTEKTTVPDETPDKTVTDGKTAPEDVDQALESEASKKRLPTMKELAPVILEVGEPGLTPEKIAIELSRSVTARTNAPALPKTVLEISPETPGAIRFAGRSTLEFIPNAAFLPSTSYTVTLRAIELEDGVITATGDTFQRVFQTPSFELARLDFFNYDVRRKSLELDLVFTGPVNDNEVKRRSSFTIKGLPPKTIYYRRTKKKHIVRVTLRDQRIDLGTQIYYAQRDGIPAMADRKATAPAARETFKIPSGETITVFASNVMEGTSGFYVQVICKDDATLNAEKGRRQGTFYYWDQHSRQSYYVSPRCVLDESDAKESVHFEPPVKFSISPTRGGFRILGNFKRGSYSMRIDADARSMDGGVLKRAFRRSFSVPARSAQLSFVSQGRYLPQDAWKNLAIRHMNLDEAELIVRHIPTENLVFWMSGQHEAADNRNSNLVLKKKIPLRGKADEIKTSFVDVASLVPKAPQGVLELHLVGKGASATARLLLTNINLVAKQESNTKNTWAWALDIHDNGPLPGVEIKQVTMSGRSLSRCTTDWSGGCALKGVVEKAVDKSPPFALIASKGRDITYLKYSELKTNIEDAPVYGRPFSAKTAYRAAIYSDRGVYRPGDEAHVVLLIRDRDALAPPTDMPVEIQLIDPRRKTVKKVVKKTNSVGMVDVDFRFPAFAETGSYSVLALAGKKEIGRYGFNVEEFVPERMKVTASAEKAAVHSSESATFETEAKYLFGGSAGGSRFEMSCELKPAPFSPKENRNYEYGVWQEQMPRPIPLGISSGELGEQGRGKLDCPSLTARGSFVGAARLTAKVAVFESGSGRTTQGAASLMVHPERYYIGLESGSDRVKAGEEVTINGIVVDWTGKQVTTVDEIALTLYRIEWEHDWIYDEQNGDWRYRSHRRLAQEGSQQVAVKKGVFKTTITTAASNWGGFIVRATKGQAQTDLQLEGEGYSYWWGDQSGKDQTPRPLKPTSIALEAPKKTRVGEEVKISFLSPFKGRALLTVETDKVVHHAWLTVDQAKVDWKFTLEEFAPNVYISAFVVKDPHLDSKESFIPNRAFGVRSITVDPVEFTHDLKLTVPKEVRSNSTLEVSLDIGAQEAPAYVTVAAVDEGILSLTKFKSPNPFATIFDRRALGVETFETIGWNLLLPAGDVAHTTGGDAPSEPGRVQPVKPVALWSGIVEVPKDGKVRIPLEVPQYRGSLRVMVVSAGKKKMGRASKNVLVRDPLVLQTTLPRFLAFGDEVQAPVFVTNLSGKKQQIEATLTAEAIPMGGRVGEKKALKAAEVVTFTGPSKQQMTVENEKSGTVVFRFKSLRSVGAAKFTVRVRAKDLQSEETLEVPFIPAAPKQRIVQRIVLKEGTLDLLPYLRGWVPTTERSSFWVTSNPYGESFDHLKYLVRYPYGCIEQTTSSTRPLLFVSSFLGNVDPAFATKDKIESMVMSGVDRLFAMQTPSGGFGYWPGASEPTDWGSANAIHLLLDAKKLRYPVPEGRLKDALDWVERRVSSGTGRPGYHRYAEPYMHYVLALAGRARKARMLKLIDELKTDAKRYGATAEQVYMLKAGLYVAGDHRFEAELKKPDVSAVSSRRRNDWSFYSDRRRRGFMLSTFVDLFGSDPAGEQLAQLVAEALRGNRSRYYTTQELVWGLTGLGKYVGEVTQGYAPPELVANGKKRAAEKGVRAAKSSDRTWSIYRASEYKQLELKVKKKEGENIYLMISSDGVRQNARYNVGGKGLRLKRTYHTATGEPVRLQDGSLELGEVVYAVVSIKNETPERVQNIALVDRFPAGWEIENPRLGRGGTVDWVDRNAFWSVDYMNLRDDRIEVFGALNRGETKKLVYALRAVTAGTFMGPPVEAEAMYDPTRWAREAGGVVKITGPWNERQ